MYNPNISRYYNNLIDQLNTKLKRQRYNARRSARRVGYSEELINEYFSTNIPIINKDSIENRDEAKAYVKYAKKALAQKTYGYKGSELNVINIDMKKAEAEIQAQLEGVYSRRESFISYYSQGRQTDLQATNISEDTYNLPKPGYTNVKKFKKQVERLKEGNQVEKKAATLKDNILKSIDSAIAKADGSLTEEEMKDLLAIKEKISNLTTQDMLTISPFTTDENLVQILASQSEVIMISKTFLSFINAYEKWKEEQDEQ